MKKTCKNSRRRYNAPQQKETGYRLAFRKRITTKRE
nr:MAG TPA: hypothetical protein [Caudoviricetes sp.]